jgi:predicted thioesterase
MIGLMELAASRAMRPILGEGELSVGVNIAVTHGAATPIGAQVTAEATFTGMQGKLYAFEVVARDPGGEIGRGTHQRAVVLSERLIKGAERRCHESA